MTKIIQGDCREVLKTLPDGSVDCCVTSPPYWGLRDYGVDGQIGLEKTPEAYVARLVEVFREVRRVVRDDGTLWLNLGDSYASTGRSDRKESPGVGAKQEMAAPGRSLKWAAGGGHNFSWSIPSFGIQIKPKDLIGIPWRVAFALQADGWYLRQDIIWHKPNPMPESVKDRCTKAHEYIFLLSKGPKYYFDAEAIKEDAKTNDPRRPYTSQGAKQLDGRTEWKSGERRDGNDFTKRNRRSVWTVNTKPYKGSHFATFPPALIAPMILAGCRVGGTVLDPFGGSGTTGEVSESLGRNSILIELNPDYIELQKKRTAQMGLGL